jgi:hypothetical protein
MSVKTYLVTLELTSETDPREWNWDNFLNLDIDEGYQVLSVTEGEREITCGDCIRPVTECGCLDE